MIIEGVALEVKKIVGCEDGIVVGFEFLGFGIPVGSNVLKDVCNCIFQAMKFVWLSQYKVVHVRQNSMTTCNQKNIFGFILMK